MGQTAEKLESRDEGHVLKLHPYFGFNPLAFPICTRTPRRNGVWSAWTGHVPFAMCLVAMTRPRVLVELGTYRGISYCAFCQAVKELRLDTQCYAVDTWQGDPHSGFYGTELLDELKQNHDPEYALFSELIRSTFDEALPRLRDRSVDVLHIDGFHTYDAVRHDFDSWLPKMSDRGIVLLHDTEVRDRESFGVWRYWDEIKQGYPHFEFHHSYGLGVLATGDSVPDALQPLFESTEADAERVRGYFQNLGDHLEELFNTTIQKNNLQELLHAKVDENMQLAAEMRELLHAKAEMAALRQHYGQFRFRAVDKVANRLRRHPRAYALLRAVARTSVHARRKLKALAHGSK